MNRLAQQIKEGAGQAWESLSEGWRELSSRASGALTRYKPTPSARPDEPDDSLAGDDLPPGRWAFMAADIFDDDDKVLVRLEAPGMRREDFSVELNGDVLTVSGEKRFDRSSSHGRWRVVQCAYGSFRRDVTLPVPVQADKTQASYRAGVLHIEMPKAEGARVQRIEVHAA